MTWANGDMIAKGSAIHRIVQPNSGTEAVRCELVDSAGNVVWHADIAPGASIQWSTHPAWEVADDLTVRFVPTPPPSPPQTLIRAPAAP